ncbi:transcriptional activator FLO8-like isoform X2 [Malania oleifera]|uniref:transcriptional activator FLO8-like isoform X2 n=1 Tax=Malania oleifera TaxID=397392 RepID=UPI0025AE3D5C|nr:transcriptional activator FLO8-like isoform X2 [Malania oleifera]
MADSGNWWNSRLMFERYLYDYLKKRNLHQVAEIFRRETDIQIDPTARPSIDVPDGFLHEWWSTFYDMFNAMQSNNHENNQALDRMAENLMEIGQQSNASLQNYESNDQMIMHPTVRADSGLTAMGDNPLPSVGWPLTGDVQMAQHFSFSQHQEDLAKLTLETSYQQGLPALTSETLYPAGNLFNLSAQEIESDVRTALRIDNVVPKEGITQMPQLWASSQNQQMVPSSTSWTLNSSGNFSDLNALGVYSSVHIASGVDNVLFDQGSAVVPPGIENYVLNSFRVSEQHQNEFSDRIPLIEASRMGTKPSYSQCGSGGIQGVANSPAEASSQFQIHNSFPHNANPSSSYAYDSENEACSSIGNLQKCSAASKCKFSERWDTFRRLSSQLHFPRS